MIYIQRDNSIPIGRDAKDVIVFRNENYKKVTNFEKFYKTALKATNERIKDLHESSLGRVLQHSEKGIALISGCRGEYDDATNKERTKWLENDLKAMGLGYIKILGGYTETDRETGEKRDVIEASFIVPYNAKIKPEEWKRKLLLLCKNYDQDSVLIKMPDEDEINYVKRDGSIDFRVGEFSLNQEHIKTYFSSLLKGTHGGIKWAFKELKNEWLAYRTPANSQDARQMDRNKMIRL